jgi:dihydroorotate dehydrogenase (fumarate)
MPDLTTTYLGLNLKNPLVASASPLSKKVDTVKRAEDAGISAIVMYSLFEEQIVHESKALDYFLSRGTESFAEALTYFPELDHYNLGPEEYLELIAKLKKEISIPVIGSLNGVSTGGWVNYAKKIEEAGADALELNIYFVPGYLGPGSGIRLHRPGSRRA